MDNNHSQQPQKSASQRCSEWVFRDVPSDITIEVDGATFALHKFPLVSRSGRIRKLIAEHRESDVSHIELLGLPGGPELFELAAQFCYGINFEITVSNVACLVCVSDYLEMTDDYSPSNLASRADEYLDSVVCKSLEMCVEVLRHCEALLPLADELNVVPRCIQAIASKACAEQIASSFSRLEYSSSGRLHMAKPASALAAAAAADWWVEDLLALRVDLYERVLAAVKCRGVRPETVGASLVHFARKELSVSGGGAHGRLVVETVVGLLPVEKSAVPLSFLFGMLRSAAALGCSDGCRSDLERRIGAQLENATLDDLLIPSFRHASDTLFDVETVRRILVNFSQMDVSDEDEEENEMDEEGSGFESDGPSHPSQTALCSVSKLVDSYLAEIAPDGNLKLAMFVAIAEALPAHARTVHDSLYRAIDIYLKAHQGLTEADRRKLCKLIDFQKLSQEAGAHAAQNERLPVQSIVQVLYYEQQRLRNSLLYNSSYPPEDLSSEAAVKQQGGWRINSGARSAAMSPRDNYASLRRENRDLKLELARMRMRLNDLEKDHVYMKRNLERSGSRKLMTSFSKKFVSRLNIFGHGSSRGSMSPSRQSQLSEARFE